MVDMLSIEAMSHCMGWSDIRDTRYLAARGLSMSKFRTGKFYITIFSLSTAIWAMEEGMKIERRSTLYLTDDECIDGTAVAIIETLISYAKLSDFVCIRDNIAIVVNTLGVRYKDPPKDESNPLYRNRRDPRKITELVMLYGFASHKDIVLHKIPYAFRY